MQSACAVTVQSVHSNALRGTLPVSSNAALLSCLVICCGELRFLSYFVIIKAKDSKNRFLPIDNLLYKEFLYELLEYLKQNTKLIPVSRTYMDNKLRELEKENKRQAKNPPGASEKQPVHAGAEGIWCHRNCIAGTTGGKRAAQVQREAKERQIWVIKCPAPEAKKDPLGRLCVCSCLETLPGSNGNVHYN